MVRSRRLVGAFLLSISQHLVALPLFLCFANHIAALLSSIRKFLRDSRLKLLLASRSNRLGIFAEVERIFRRQLVLLLLRQIGNVVRKLVAHFASELDLRLGRLEHFVAVVVFVVVLAIVRVDHVGDEGILLVALAELKNNFK